VGSRAEVALFATGSIDPDGDPITFTWTQADGPKVELVAADTARPHFIAPAVEEETALVFQLITHDNRGADSVPSKVTITVSPEPKGDPGCACSAGNDVGAIAFAGLLLAFALRRRRAAATHSS
jgi:MYXO-CTERM domain-containing protein